MSEGPSMSSAARHGRHTFWRALLAAWLVALAIGMANAPVGQAFIELKEFTATAQDNGTILVRWVTGSEWNTLGFRVYRALTATGPWLTAVYEEDARSDGETDTVYEFVDAEVTAGETYYYLLEEIEYDDISGENRSVRYVDRIAQATVGPAGKTPVPATATPTATFTRTATPTATFTRISTPTATAGATGAGPSTSTATPTATAVGATGTATPTATGRPTATSSSPAGTATATSVAPTATASRTATVAGPLAPTPTTTLGTATRPAAATGRPTATPSATTTAAGAPLPTPAIAPTSVPLTVRPPGATPTPAIFAAKAPATPTPLLAATRPLARDGQVAPASDHGERSWALSGGVIAIVAAAALVGLAAYLWRRRRGRL